MARAFIECSLHTAIWRVTVSEVEGNITIVLQHRRNPELVDDQHHFSGSVALLSPRGEVWDDDNFVALPFHQMMTMVARRLREFPDADVVLQRTDRRGLSPLKLGEDVRVMLRDDPAGAVRAMSVSTGQHVEVQVPPTLRSSHDTLADAFGERLYLQMRRGYVADPLTGSYQQLSYGEKSGWRIRGPGNSYEQWLPIRLEGVEVGVDPKAMSDDPGALMQELGKMLAELRWVSCSTEDLLSMPGSRFFLPRRWNAEGMQWISRQALRERLDQFRKERDHVG